jgi:GMP reductase
MKYYDYKDVVLIPKMGIVDSRSQCNTSIKFGGFQFKLPVVPANMESVIDEDLAVKFAKNGYFYIMHRFGVDNIQFVRKMKSMGLISSISIGVNEDSYLQVEELISGDLVPDFITIDIAHGHSIKMKRMLEFLKSKNIKSFIIAGNVCTEEAANDLTMWGADCIKAGIAPGEACTTYQNTSFGSRGYQASMIRSLANHSGVPIIADGGIRQNGDINVALTMGATMVMIGGMLSCFQDSPGNVVIQNGVSYKEFWGSASQFQSGKKNRIEGTKILKVMKNKTLIEELVSIEEAIQSGISYAGGSDLSSFNNVQYIIKT